jgi:hypothetical protein
MKAHQLQQRVHGSGKKMIQELGNGQLSMHEGKILSDSGGLKTD